MCISWRLLFSGVTGRIRNRGRALNEAESALARANSKLSQPGGWSERFIPGDGVTFNIGREATPEWVEVKIRGFWLSSDRKRIVLNLTSVHALVAGEIYDRREGFAYIDIARI